MGPACYFLWEPVNGRATCLNGSLQGQADVGRGQVPQFSSSEPSSQFLIPSHMRRVLMLNFSSLHLGINRFPIRTSILLPKYGVQTAQVKEKFNPSLSNAYSGKSSDSVLLPHLNKSSPSAHSPNLRSEASQQYPASILIGSIYSGTSSVPTESIFKFNLIEIEFTTCCMTQSTEIALIWSFLPAFQ